MSNLKNITTYALNAIEAFQGAYRRHREDGKLVRETKELHGTVDGFRWVFTSEIDGRDYEVLIKPIFPRGELQGLIEIKRETVPAEVTHA